MRCLRFILEKIDYNKEMKYTETYSKIKYLSENTDRTILKLLYSSICFYFSYKIFKPMKI